MFKKDNPLIRINLLICIIIVAGFSLIAFLNYHSDYYASLESIERVSSLASQSIYYQLESVLSKPLHASLMMSNDNVLKNDLSQELKNQEFTDIVTQYLQKCQNQYQCDSVFLVSTQTDRYYCFDGKNRILNSQDTWYYSFLESDQDYTFHMNDDESSKNDIALFIDYKVKDTRGNVIGIIGVGIHLDSIQSILKTYEDDFKVKAYFINEHGNIEISTKYLGYQNKNFFQLMNLESLEEKVLNSCDEKQVGKYWIHSNHLGQQDDFIESRFIKDLSWHFIIEKSNQEALQLLNKQLYTTIAVIAGILILILFVVTYVIKGFNKLIEERNIAFRKATEKLYDNIYELNITKNCSANVSTQRYFESLGAPPSLPYNEGLKVIAQKQIKDEYREGYIQTFCTENVLKQYELGNTDLRYDFLITEDGTHYYWMRIDARVYYNKEDNCIHMFTYRKNIDKEKRQEIAMMKEARIDNLTQLYNRASIQTIIEKRLLTDPHHLHAFFILDIDHFKKANDLYGHAFGDYVLMQFAKTLKDNFRSEDIVGRLGGDEFIVFLPIPSIEFVYKKVKSLQKALNQEIIFDGSQMEISASIGVCMAPQDGVDFVTLYKKADQALYISKESGRNTFTIYNEKS